MSLFTTSAINHSENTVARRPLALLCALLGAVALLLATVQPALAHDELTGSDPASGASLETAPGKLTLTFSGNVSDIGHEIHVTDPEGKEITTGEPTVDRTRLTQRLKEDGAPGTYTVVWRTVSQDGHPIEGNFTYSVGESAGQESATPTTQASASEGADAARETGVPGVSGMPGWVLAVIGTAVVLGIVGMALAATRRRKL